MVIESLNVNFLSFSELAKKSENRAKGKGGGGGKGGKGGGAPNM